MQTSTSQLSRVQHAAVPLLSKCFRVGCEVEGAMLPGHARPTSSQCEEFLIKKIWQDTLKLEPWHLYHKTLPAPKRTALQRYGPHQLANFYLENMEMGMLKMTLSQCERLITIVDPLDRPTVARQMQHLHERLDRTAAKAKSHRQKADQDAFAAESQRQVSLGLPA